MDSSQFQASARQQQLRMPSPSAGATQFSDSHSFSQLHHKGSNSTADPAHIPASSVQMQVSSTYAIKENNAQKPRELERPPGSHGIHASQMASSSPSTVNQERERSAVLVQGLNKQQQQHLHFPQTSYPMYGSSGANYHPYSATNVNPPGSSLKPHPHDSQMRQISHHQNMGSASSGGASQAMNTMNLPKFERQNSVNELSKVQGGSISHFTNSSKSQQNIVPWQPSPNKEHNPSSLSSMAYVKPEPVDQVIDQQHKSLPSTPQGLSVAPVEQGNAIPGTMKDEGFEKQSPRIGFSTSTSMLPSNSVSPSTTTQQDSNVPVILYHLSSSPCIQCHMVLTGNSPCYYCVSFSKKNCFVIYLYIINFFSICGVLLFNCIKQFFLFN